jgi:glycosyltransferase involved in cell wall biosynthesis
MHVLFLDQFASIGGAQQCLLDLLPMLQVQACTAEVVLPGRGAFAEKVSRAGTAVRLFKGGRLSSKTKPLWQVVPYWLAVRNATQAITGAVFALRPDIIYVNGPRYLPAAAHVARTHKIPLLFHAHNRVLQRAALKIVASCLTSCESTVVSCCRYVAASLSPMLPDKHLPIIYSGVPDLRISRPIEIGPIRRVGVIGRIAPEKGQLEFLQGMQMIRDSVREIEFLIVGSGSPETERYTEAVERASRGLRVTFTGWEEKIEYALSRLQLLVVPSLAYDAAPRVILEAFSAGVPVLATPVGGIPELIESENVNGYLTTGATPAQVAERMLELIRLSGCDLHRVRCNARRRWEECFRIERHQQAVWDLLQSCVYNPRTTCVVQ